MILDDRPRFALQWHEVNKDERVVGKALGDVLPVLRSSTPDESSEDCEWGRYVKLSVAEGKTPISHPAYSWLSDFDSSLKRIPC